MPLNDTDIFDDSAINNDVHEDDKERSILNEEDRTENISINSLRHDAVHFSDRAIREGMGDIADAASTLCEIKKKNVDRPLLCHLKVYGIHNKFECLHFTHFNKRMLYQKIPTSDIFPLMYHTPQKKWSRAVNSPLPENNSVNYDI